MAVASMTGFARGTGQDGTLTWAWEAKSVNARGLDMRCRLPSGMDALEPAARRRVSERFKRGNFNLALQVNRAAGNARVEINHGVLDQVLAVVCELRDDHDVEAPRADGLLNVRGVIEITEDDGDPADSERRDAAILASLDQTLDALAGARAEEGGRIGAVLAGQLDDIAALTDAARASEANQPARRRQRFAEQVAELIDSTLQLSEERLNQEVALLLVKADTREETDRLYAHIAAARELLDEGGPVGRRLDFLCQEFNREGNTLCSKAAEVELTAIGLDLKAVIDQFREQVQNME
ncbi:MAG: YicC/YloC family endoribonuclease [Alphaproteobacteria bacterium]